MRSDVAATPRRAGGRVPRKSPAALKSQGAQAREESSRAPCQRWGKPQWSGVLPARSGAEASGFQGL